MATEQERAQAEYGRLKHEVEVDAERARDLAHDRLRRL